MFQPANSIDEILIRLDEIIAETRAGNNPLGLFAYIYRRTTAQIRQAILEGKFEDNQGLEKLDVHFANKYLEAYEQYHSGLECSAPWKVAFDAGKENHIILQHILLGMNAHINYDLGLTASEIAPGSEIHSIRNDFMKVNEILESLTDEMQSRLGRVSPLMFLLDWIGKRNDEAVINFSMVKAREQAWNLALLLASATPAEKKAILENTASVMAGLGRTVRRPPGRLTASVLRFISYFEKKDIGKILQKIGEDR